MSAANGNTLPQSVGGTCFNAQTYLGYKDEYGNGTQLNTDLGGAIIACSCKPSPCFLDQGEI